MTAWETLLYSQNICSTSNSIIHFLYIGLARYLQQRKKKHRLCVVPEHSRLSLKPRLVLGRFASLTSLLNLFEVPGFSIHKAHLITQHMANDCILLFQRCLSPLHSLPSLFCRGLNEGYPQSAAFESWSQNSAFLGGSLCRQDTVPAKCSVTCAGHDTNARNSLRAQYKAINTLVTQSLTTQKQSNKVFGLIFIEDNQVFFPHGRLIWSCAHCSPVHWCFRFYIWPQGWLGTRATSWGSFHGPWVKWENATMQCPHTRSQIESIESYQWSWNLTVLWLFFLPPNQTSKPNSLLRAPVLQLIWGVLTLIFNHWIFTVN